jgi:hypothetical protein
MDQTKLDCLPNIEHVIKAADMFTSSGMKMNDHWNKDQKADFYLGMFAAMRIFHSGVVMLKKSEWETLDDLERECYYRLGEIANIIMDKYDLKGFKV